MSDGPKIGQGPPAGVPGLEIGRLESPEALSSASKTTVHPQKTADLLKAAFSSNPSLEEPLMALGIALEVLARAIGAKERETAVKGSMEALKSEADDIKTQNEKELSEIKTRIDELRKQEALSPILKAFKIIGMIIGAIASIATIAAGALTANPALIAVGVMSAIMVTDSIVSESTDGKASIMKAVSSLAEALGADKETAQWIALGAYLAISAVTIAMSFGAAGAGTAASAATTATKAMNILNTVKTASNLANAVNMIGTGVLTVMNSVYEYNTTMSKSRSKEIEAALERIKSASEVEEGFLKFVLEKYSDMLEQVTEIIKSANNAQRAVLTGGSGAPSMA